MKLILFELKKMFGGKTRWIFILLLLANAAVYYIYLIPSIPTAQEKMLTEDWNRILAGQSNDAARCLELLETEMADLSLLNNYFIDKSLLSEDDAARIIQKYEGTIYMNRDVAQCGIDVLISLTEQYQSVVSYQAFIGGLDQRADAMKGTSIFAKGNSFSKRNIEKTVKDFAKVKDIQLTPVDGTGVRRIQNYYLTDILLIMGVCLLSFQMFGYDAKSGMANLICATPGGKLRLRVSQMLAVLLATFCISFVFYLSNFIQTALFIGTDFLPEPVQTMAEFRNVAYPWTLGQYLLLYLAGKICAVLLLSLLCQFLAVILKGEKLAWVVFGISIAASFLLWFLISDTPAAKLFRYLNFVGVLDMRQILGNYQNLNLFSFPFSLLNAVLIFFLTLSTLLICMILFVRGVRIQLHLPDKKLSRHGYYPKSVIFYEFYKTILNQKVWMIGLLLILAGCLTFDTTPVLINREDFFYMRYIEIYQGDYTDQKAQQIEEIISNPGNMTSEEYNALRRISEQSEYLRSRSDDQSGFVNTYVLDQFFCDTKSEISNALLMIIALILSLCMLFYQDRRNHMNTLLQATPNGKKIYWRKIAIAAGLGAVYSIILWGFTYCEYFIRYGAADFQYSIQSYARFEELPLHLSIGAYMVLTVIFRCIIGMYMGILIAFITQVFVNPTYNIIVAGLLFVFPLCLSYVAHMGYENTLIAFINQNLQFVLRLAGLISSFQCEFWSLGFMGKTVILIIPMCTLWGGRKLSERF